jgi:hypothetical protein
LCCFKLTQEFIKSDAGARIVGCTQNSALQQILSQILMRLQLAGFIEKNEDSFGWVGEHASFDPIKDPESEFGRQIRLKSQTALCCRVTKNVCLLTRPRPEFLGGPSFIRLICHSGAPYLGGVFT